MIIHSYLGIRHVGGELHSIGDGLPCHDTEFSPLMVFLAEPVRYERSLRGEVLDMDKAGHRSKYLRLMARDKGLGAVPALLAHLSTLYHLGPGDLVMTGTPSGVGAVGLGLGGVLGLGGALGRGGRGSAAK